MTQASYLIVDQSTDIYLKKNQQSYNSQLMVVDSEFITFHEQS